MQNMNKNCKKLYKIDHTIYIHWISKHVEIWKNLLKDKQAKKRLKKIKNQNNFTSFYL